MLIYQRVHDVDATSDLTGLGHLVAKRDLPAADFRCRRLVIEEVKEAGARAEDAWAVISFWAPNGDGMAW